MAEPEPESERTVLFSLPNALQGQLACVEGTVAGRSFELSAGTFIIGRLAESDLPLSNEPGVSKLHAKIVGQGDHYEIVDCESRNGTMVNGQNITHYALRDGDEIRVCGCVLRFTQRAAGNQRLKAGAHKPPGPPTDAYARPSAGPASALPPASGTPSLTSALTSARTIPELPPSLSPMAAVPPVPTAAPIPGASSIPASAGWTPPPQTMTAGLAEHAQLSAQRLAGDAGPASAAPNTGYGAFPIDASDKRAPPATGSALLRWYFGGLVLSLIVGGAAALVLLPTLEGELGSASFDAGALAAADPAAPGLPAPDPAAAGATASAPLIAAPGQSAPSSPPPPAPAEGAPASPPPTAAAPPDGLEVAGLAAPKTEERRRRRTMPRRPEAVDDADGTSEAPADGEQNGVLYSTTVDGGRVESIRSKSGGRVKTVTVKEGDVVSRGQTLVIFAAGSEEELATLEDRIASLDNTQDEEGKRELKNARQKLAALQGGNAAPIIAGMDGTVQGLVVSEGAVLRPGESVGRILDAEVPSRVRIRVEKGARPKKGQSVTLLLKNGGDATGSVLLVSGRTVVIDTGSEPGDAVDAVRF